MLSERWNSESIELIPACLDKCKDGKFLGVKEFDVCNVNTEVAACVTSRYYKGISAHHDNLVIVKIKNE